MDRYQKAITDYLAELKSIVLEAAIDYHRIAIDQDYEQVLLQFLAGRTKARGVR